MATNAPQAAEVAFLVLAHHQPQALARLSSRLSADWSHLFVHIDRRAEVEGFAKQAAGNVTFLPDGDRVRIYWSGFSMVRATLNLLRYAVAAAPRAHRFMLLSGADYPIKPLAYIRDTLALDQEFIQIERRIMPQGNSIWDLRVNRPYFRDNRFFNDRSVPGKVVSIATGLESRMKRRHPDGLEIYQGPQWWGITRTAAEEILAFVDANPRVVRWFTLVQTPDETFFQTVLAATSRRRFVAFDAFATNDPIEESQNGLHYIDWTTPNPALPRVLELPDLQPLIRSQALFARKMDISRSTPLMDAIDESCLRRPYVTRITKVA